MFFFFKQKTAYEMRISDWSSDVCSSDLAEIAAGHDPGLGLALAPVDALQPGGDLGRLRRAGHVGQLAPALAAADHAAHNDQRVGLPGEPRSEEHTSELQSLMRISYAVFCLKKKKKTKRTTSN